MKFLSTEVALYLHKSTRQSWNINVMFGLESLDKLQKQICRNVGPSLNACFEALVHLRNVASFSIDITLLDLHPNWLSWFHFLNLEGGLLVILINCMNFLSPLLDATRMTLEFAYRMLSFDL